MRIILALLLNAALLGGLLVWLRRQHQKPRIGGWVLPTLLLKLATTGLSVRFMSEDSYLFTMWARRMTVQFWQQPKAWLQMLGQEEFHFGSWHLIYHGFSNTLFMMKVLSMLNVVSGGVVWLNALYLSLFSFWGAWTLACTIGRLWPAARPGGVVIGFLLWPTVVYWTSGLTKESLLVGSGAALLAYVLQLYYPLLSGRQWQKVALVILLGWLHFKMRFFFAAVLLGVLAGLGLIRVLQRLTGTRRRMPQLLLMVGLLSAGAWAASEISPAFRLNKFTSQLQRNYTDLLAISRNRPHLEYPTLAPTTESVLRNAPAAIFNATTRPWPWEGTSLLYLIAGMENALLAALLLLAAWAVVQRRSGKLPFGVMLALLLYCLLLAILLGLSTPNLGTLSRYRVAFLPFLLLLITQNEYFCGVVKRLRG
ncbi:hypothetical protein [Hymenobacter sp. AT01-02]|uniref:hypothetical protein n=1 Tax=Hymenobacter sp. AT01-02 TaxID=1571877 RepID=UPI00128FCBDA|nr:hypothetical protein [Hymenobacter sp. AT01-02]